MSRLAIDVALLPDAEMTDAMIRINRRLQGPPELVERIRLYADRYVPHISFLMCCIESRYLENIKGILREIADTYRSIPLTTTELEIYKLGDSIACGLGIEKGQILSDLRRRVVDDLGPYATYDPESSDYYPVGANIDPSSMKLLASYAARQGDPGFLPHITLGFGTPDKTTIKYPHKFRGSVVALCHMGDNCTCAKVLGSFDLSVND